VSVCVSVCAWVAFARILYRRSYNLSIAMAAEFKFKFVELLIKCQNVFLNTEFSKCLRYLIL